MVAAEAVEDVGEQTRAPELAVRQVDADVDDAVVRALPLGDLPAHLVDDPTPEGDQQPGLVHDRQELHGPHETAIGVVPAHQRLEVVGALRIEIDDRLVMHLELPAIHRLTQF